jgi:hypothetical protein
VVGSSCAKGVLRDLLSTWRFRTQRRVPRDRSVRLLGSSAGLLQDVQTVMAIDVAITEYDVVDLRYVTFRSADASDVVDPRCTRMRLTRFYQASTRMAIPSSIRCKCRGLLRNWNADSNPWRRARSVGESARSWRGARVSRRVVPAHIPCVPRRLRLLRDP